MIDFLAYDDDNRALRASVDLVGYRLTDLLLRGGMIPARDIVTHDLRTRRVAELDADAIDPAHLCIVVGTGPRGSRSHRVETASRPVSISIARYTVHGFLHAPVPTDPMEHAHGRSWLPVTEAVLEHHGVDRVWRERFDTLLVNGTATKAIVVISETVHEMHWLAAGPPVVFADEVGAPG